jgi:hypothetical protein
MPQPPRRLDLRLTIPAAAPYLAVAGELAAKFAQYAGADPDAAHELARQVESSVTPFAEARPEAPVDLEMSAGGHELVVTVKAGATKTLTCPLPD